MDIKVPMHSDTIHSKRKERVHWQMFSEKPLFQRICMARSGLMLSKNPEMSNRMRVPAWLEAWVAWIL